MDQDFGEAKLRVTKAALGLVAFYDYPGTLPLATTTGLGIYDRYLISVRQAISFVGALVRRDQRFVVVVSVKSLVGEEAWQSGLASGKWKFALGSESLSRYRLLRLRGIALSVISKPESRGEDVWTGDVTFVQTLVTGCYASRIQARDPLRVPDLIGDRLLHNLNPFKIVGNDASWEISLNPQSLFGLARTEMIVDLLIDLHLVAQSKPEA